MKKILFIALSAVLLTTGCGDLTLSGTTSIGGGNNNNNNGGNTGNDNSSTGNDNVTQTPVSIKVDNTTVSLDLETNTSFKLNAYTASEDGSNIGGVTYISENTQIATVTNDGTITAVAKGYTFITITSLNDSSLTTSVEVIITEKAGESGPKYKITASPSSLSIDKDSNKLLSQISLTFTPPLEAGAFIYHQSKDTSIAKIVGSGNAKAIQGVALGNTVLQIGVTGQAGSYIDIPVLVKEAGLPEPIMYPDINPSEAEQYKDRMYFKIKFDAFSSTGDLYNSSNYAGINAVVFDNKLCGSGQTCSGDLINKGNGHINPFGYCEKYGCTQNGQSYENGRIAEKNVGITYYAGNNKLYVPVSTTGGTQNYVIYIVLETLSGNHYTRENISFPINWNEYNPLIHKNIAKFTLTYKDKTPTVVFDGFESK